MVQRVTRQTLSQQALRNLQQYILDQGLGPGDRLPTERELAADLGVSGLTVREALKSLEAIGALTRRPKLGTVLQPIDFGMLAEVAQFQMLNSADDLTELFAARRLLEMSVIPMVVQNATEEHFQHMDQAIQSMQAEIDDGGLGVDGDMAFHQALLAGTKNKFLTQFGALLQEFFRRARIRVLTQERERGRSVEDHRRILQALRERDIERAQQLMEAHLDHYQRWGLAPPSSPPSGS